MSVALKNAQQLSKMVSNDQHHSAAVLSSAEQHIAALNSAQQKSEALKNTQKYSKALRNRSQHCLAALKALRYQQLSKMLSSSQQYSVGWELLRVFLKAAEHFS